jgi:NADH:ubiquinone oxidoreductase subunit 11 or 4L (chain K)
MVCVTVYFYSIIGTMFSQNNYINMLICIETSFLASFVQCVTYSIAYDDLMGIIFSIMILTVAGGDSAVGLSLTIFNFKGLKSIKAEYNRTCF